MHTHTCARTHAYTVEAVSLCSMVRRGCKRLYVRETEREREKEKEMNIYTHIHTHTHKHTHTHTHTNTHTP